MQAITDSLVPFTWFLIPVFIAALALALLILFALQTSRTARWFVYWSESRGFRKPEGWFRLLLRRRSQERRGGRAEPPRASREASGAEPRDLRKSRALQRLGRKAEAAPRKSVAERLADLSAKPDETLLVPSLPEEVLRRLEARRPPTASAGRASAAQALQTSRQMTESMLRSLEEQVRQGLLTPQTYEELKARLAAMQGGGARPG